MAFDRADAVRLGRGARTVVRAVQGAQALGQGVQLLDGGGPFGQAQLIAQFQGQGVLERQAFHPGEPAPPRLPRRGHVAAPLVFRSVGECRPCLACFMANI